MDIKYTQKKHISAARPRRTTVHKYTITLLVHIMDVCSTMCIHNKNNSVSITMLHDAHSYQYSQWPTHFGQIWFYGLDYYEVFKMTANISIHSIQIVYGESSSALLPTLKTMSKYLLCKLMYFCGTYQSVSKKLEKWNKYCFTPSVLMTSTGFCNCSHDTSVTHQPYMGLIYLQHKNPITDLAWPFNFCIRLTKLV
jgi:hypothetical protein